MGIALWKNLYGGRMSVKSDMYSLGIIIIELVTGHKDTKIVLPRNLPVPVYMFCFGPDSVTLGAGAKQGPTAWK